MRVLIIGGGTGIGRAVAELLVGDGGHTVVVAGRRKTKLDEVHGAYAVQCDVTDARQREVLFAQADTIAHGTIDALVYAAGVVHHQLPGSIDEHALREQIEVNLVAPLRLGEIALAALSDGGSMVFISSILADTPIATSMVYSATKAGLIQVTKALALAGATRGIRVETVSPGLVDTEMLRAPRPEGYALDPSLPVASPASVAETIVGLL